ncbi:MAG TPA: response regulator transcription factor [Thermoanaerobaculia bacterium]
MKILIADDHALFRESLAGLLAAHGLEVVGQAREGAEAVELARRLLPDIVLMDLAMPGEGGLAATRLISAELPQVKVVVLTGSDEDANLFDAIKSGAHGYLLKNLESRELFAILEGVGRGEPGLTPFLAAKLLQEFARPTRPAPEVDDPDALTDREREVLELLVRGVTSNRKLAKQLAVSENTVKFHVRNILDKLHLHNRAQAVGFALRHGIVEAPAKAEPPTASPPPATPHRRPAG